MLKILVLEGDRVGYKNRTRRAAFELTGLRHFLWLKKPQSYTHQSFNLDLVFFLIYLGLGDFLGFEVYPLP
jgi:hypothetical protein